MRTSAATIRSELWSMTKRNGVVLDRRLFDALAKNTQRMRRDHAKLVSDLDAKRITPDGYVTRFEEVLRDAMAHNREILGEETYTAIFGTVDPDGMIDRDLFLKRGVRSAKPGDI